MRVFASLVLGWGLLFGGVGALSALADGGNSALSGEAETSLPSDLRPVSIQSELDDLLARIDDWTEELEQARSRGRVACTISGVGAFLSDLPSDAFKGGMVPIKTLLLSLELSRYWKSGELRSESVRAPWSESLEEVEKTVSLTVAEHKALQRLSHREVRGGQSDWLRLFIDTESFLMKVSRRIYEERIESHRRRLSEAGWLELPAIECSVSALQADLNQLLLRAAGKLVELYGFLKREQGD